MDLWSVLAQTPPPSPDLIERYGNLGATAVLGLALLGVLYYGIKSILPGHWEHVEKLIGDHNAAVAKLTTAHNESIQALKDEYIKVIKEVRDECKDERQQFLVELRTERAMRDEQAEKQREQQRQTEQALAGLTSAINRNTEVTTAAARERA